MSEAEGIERVPTGIPGLDEMLEGGLPRGYVVLLAGGPGSGKSTLAMQFLYKGAEQYNEPGVYITLEERPRDIIRNFSRYGWDLSRIKIIGLIPQKATLAESVKYVASYETPEGVEIEGEKESNVLEFSPKKFSIDLVKDVITREVKKIDAKRIVVDSIASLAAQLDNAFEIRQEILGLVNLLNELGTTSLILTEMPHGKEGISRFGVEEFMAQGVIALYNIKKGSERVRGLEILKMRGTNHSKRICMFDITNFGIVVYPSENLYRE